MEPPRLDWYGDRSAGRDHQRQPNRMYPDSKWREMKPIIKTYYLDNNCTLSAVMQKMADNYDFNPTVKMYKLRFRSWGFTKNITENRLQAKESLPPQRLAKYLRRKRLGAGSTAPTADPSPLMNDTTVGPDIIPSSHVTLRANTYEDTCPYRFFDKKFRLVETFPDGTVYRADSLGYRAYIDLDEARPCTQRCFCQSDSHALSADFVFTVYKSPQQMDVTIRSDALLVEIRKCVPEDSLFKTERTLNALVLLRHHASLQRQLLAICRPSHELTLELRLLVHGLLGDGQVFRSFGYEHLYECDYLGFDLWRLFQQQQLDSDIDDLHDAFGTIDDWEEFSAISIDCPMSQTELQPGTSSSLQDIETRPTAVAGTPLHETPERTSHGAQRNSCNFGKIHEPIPTIPDEEYRSPHQIESNGSPPPMNHESVDQDQPLRTFKDGVLYSQLGPAIESGDREVIQLFLDRGLDVNAEWLFGSPVLRWAAGSGHQEIVQLLLDHGADTSQRSYRGMTALSSAAIGGHQETVQLLLDRGADVNARELYEETALFSAAWAGHQEIVQLLLDRGADVNAQSHCGKTALFSAARGEHREIVQLLLDRGADVEARGPYGETALFSAAAGGRQGIVQLLLDNGANIDSTGICGPALSGAVTNGQDAIVRYLLQRGADIQLAAICRQELRGNMIGPGRGREFLRKVWRIQNGHSSSGNSEALPYLRRKFLDQYRLMSEAGRQSHTKFRTSSHRFPTYRQAWRAGIDVIRRLTHGNASMDVYETVVFLSLARAIVETLRDLRHWDYTNDFNNDLPRWQQLFSDKADDFDAYQETAMFMWGIDLATMFGQSDSDPDTLHRLAELASILVGRTRDLLDLDFSDGDRLEQSQHRWRERQSKLSPESRQDNPYSTSFVSLPMLPPSPWTSSRPPDFDDPYGVNSTEDRPPNPMVILFIISAIFSILIIFLQELRRCTSGHAISFPFRGVSSLDERLAVMSGYLGTRRMMFIRQQGAATVR